MSGKNINKKGYFALYAIHTKEVGTFIRVVWDKQIVKYIIEKHIIKNRGDLVKPFKGVNNSIGFVIFMFPTKTLMNNIISNIKSFIKIEIKI